MIEKNITKIKKEDRPKIVVFINQKGIDTVGLVASTYEKEQEIWGTYIKIRNEINEFREKVQEKLTVN